MAAPETIAAIATAPGFGAIGVVRVSGPAVPTIAGTLLGRLPRPRQAVLRRFRDADGGVIDQGLALYFPAPRSFTGEHLLELHGHGGPVVLDLLLARVLALGARPARPGEFSERAFLNGKLDLLQAEAIADLIGSSTVTGARLASRSLQGAFSRRVDALQQGLTRLRTLVEAHLDFPDEDLPAAGGLAPAMQGLLTELEALRDSAQQGELVREGYRVVIAGPPNAGKSSLLNALSGRDAAIVTAVPGTTRDPLRVDIQIDGLPLRVIDTAGLRESSDPVEQEGIRRARAEAALADHLLWVVDASVPDPEPDVRAIVAASLPELPAGIQLTRVRNKIDLLPTGQRVPRDGEIDCSAYTGEGLDRLRAHLRHQARYRGPAAGEFSARRRHLNALDRAGEHLRAAFAGAIAGASDELLAEDLRQTQQALAELTGEVSADDLLERIFREFCIGK